MLKNVFMKVAPSVIIKDIATGWENFQEQVTIMPKVKELPKALRDIKPHSNGRKSYRAIAKILNIPQLV